MTIEIGKKAPFFRLKDEAGNPVALKDLEGEWTVVYFYPKDDTPGCTVEACEFTKDAARFKKLGAQVFGVSRDSAASHQKFIKKHRLNVKLLTDDDASVMRKYGAWGEKNMYGKVTEGVIRSTVLIDPKGKVAHVWSRVKAQGHAAQVREKIEELQAQS